MDFTTPDEDSWGDLFPVLRSPMIGKATLICFVWDPRHDQITGRTVRPSGAGSLF